ncbi:MAG: hypothetical protein LBD30_00930 [Verrucomicrobiales bacterium]|jgi:Fic family protein|nr:hypothetical protein [Verrucomicrobiales bacterium]
MFWGKVDGQRQRRVGLMHVESGLAAARMAWFFACLSRSTENTDAVLGKILRKAEFWRKNSEHIPGPAQRQIINLSFDGFAGHLTSGKVEKICKISQDTATRLLKDLVGKGCLQVHGGGRSTHYVLK